MAASALGHALMSGQTVPVRVVAYAFAATTVGAWWLTGRERGALVVTGATVAAQFVLHTVFNLSQLLPAPSAMSASMAAHRGMAGMGGMSDSVDMAATGHSWSLGMGLAHGLAALVCGVWLWCGEAAAFRLAGRWPPPSSHRSRPAHGAACVRCRRQECPHVHGVGHLPAMPRCVARWRRQQLRG
ncbi:hypothetical protein [Streptomyces noursei]|uniref:hypothetical protein n=1 Tax=Streptomyces noursei TaxID=1971 RepID=UPI0013EFA61F|nr:hypothetical protein [Streptomyces noursei]